VLRGAKEGLSLPGFSKIVEWKPGRPLEQLIRQLERCFIGLNHALGRLGDLKIADPVDIRLDGASFDGY
jgi:hypothetical protein